MDCTTDITVERTAEHVIKVPLELQQACVVVQRNDTVFLPFDLPADSYGTMRIMEKNGNLLIEGGDTSILLQDFQKTIDETGSGTLILREANGTPIDIPMWLAITDPNLDVQ